MIRQGLLLLFLISSSVFAEFEDVVITTTHVAGSVHMLEGRGGNLAVIAGADGVVLVDDQYAPLTDRILEAIAEISPEPVRFVINTHWHFDHTGGNENLGEGGAVIVAHDNVRLRMMTGQYLSGIDRRVPPSPREALPVVTFSDRASFHLNGETVVAHHVAAAHTDGDSIIHFPDSDVIHMGDVFFHGVYPFIDLDSGGSVPGTINAVQAALMLCGSNTRVIPGHGPLANCADLESYGQMLADSAERVRRLKRKGMSREEVIAARPNREQDGRLGAGWIDPERFTGLLYDSVVEP
ncbi:MAG: MBL fold metallo-hydrolase [Gammaproteobacteria bacterium]|nr:MBL fold metallo-hydrolase [Gammaproteobacteria bacterium]